jgi:lantibiotic modifying enzyme
LASALDRLIETGLLIRQGLPPHASYLFKHALVQDAAYGTLLREPRHALHARIAEVLESHFAEIVENQPELLARHCTEAGLTAKASGLWGKAGQGVASRAGVLKGATPESRFSFFCECLKDQDFAASLLAQYPVLVRRCMHPVPVDLETLFHFTPLPDDLDGATARGLVELRRSVVRAQVLPGVSSFGDDPKDFVDISALSHSGEQLTPSPVAGWASIETDRMRLIYKRAEIPPGLSLPQFAGQQVQSGAYVDAVVHGFEQTYEFLRKFKVELLAPQGPLSAFLGKPTRRVCRDTATYGLTLFASHHPRFQRDAIACEAMLHDALRASSGGDWRWLKVLEDKEVSDLLACDIPYFFSSVGSGDYSGHTVRRRSGSLAMYTWVSELTP